MHDIPHDKSVKVSGANACHTLKQASNVSSRSRPSAPSTGDWHSVPHDCQRDRVKDRLRIREIAWHSDDGRACPAFGDALRDIGVEERQDMRGMAETRLLVCSFAESSINLDIIGKGLAIRGRA